MHLYCNGNLLNRIQMTNLQIDLDLYANEEALLEGLKNGDRYACACLLKQYAPRVYAIAMRMMGDPDEAEEVLQETFISACKHIEKFEGRSSLNTWLHRIATNAALMRLRKKKKLEISLDMPMESLGSEDIPRQIEDWTYYPIDHTLNSETRDIIEKAILELPDSLRTVFILREIEGYSTAETAELLNISVSAAKVRLHRARLQLREALTPYFTEMIGGSA